MGREPIASNLKSSKETQSNSNAMQVLCKCYEGHQEFRIRVDKAEGFIAVDGNTVVENKYRKEQTTQHYVLNGDHNLTTRKLNKSNLNNTLLNTTRNKSDDWQKGISRQRMLAESGLTCWICNTYVQGEIGIHLAKNHYARLIWARKTPRL